MPVLARKQKSMKQEFILKSIEGKPVSRLVGLGGFEPPTSPLSGVRSNQLSYRPKLYVGNISNQVANRPHPALNLQAGCALSN